MKSRKMLDIMGMADDKYINEADPSVPIKAKQKPKFKWSTFLAAACCFLLILNIAVIVPLLSSEEEPNLIGTDSGLNHIQNPGNDIVQNNTQTSTDNSIPDTPQSTQDPPVIDQSPQFIKNTALLEALDSMFKGGASSDGAINDATEDLGGNLEDETIQETVKEEFQEELNKGESSSDKISTDLNDNQVAGIKEGDIAKKSDKFLYYLNDKKLYVYSINKSHSQAECILPLDKYLSELIDFESSLEEGLLKDELEKVEDYSSNYTYSAGWEMYLSDDYSTLTIIMVPKYCQMTGIFTFDVSASPTVELKDFKIFSGSYVTSRVVDDEILLFTRYYVYRGYDKENPLTYMPFYVTNEQEFLTDDIYFPSELNTNAYIMVSRLEAGGLEVSQTVSYLSYSDKIYVSENNIFLTRALNAYQSYIKDITTKEEIPDIWDTIGSRTPYNTDIAVIGYNSDFFQNKGTVKIQGYIKDQYSLDEHEGILRAVTTSYMENDMGVSSASLYCIDISKMQVVASVERFAPEGEIVRSVRFDGTTAYVCTSYQEVLVDPVFFFDLSDLENITYTQTGEIDGYSSSLINIGGGYVVGIGYGDSTSNLKIEAFKENGNAVETVCVEEFTNTRFATDYKAQYIDRERHLIGLAISTYDSSTNSYTDYYLLLHFNGSYFDHVVTQPISHSAINAVRGFYQDEYFYVVTDQAYKAVNVGSLDDLYFVTADGEATTETQGSLSPAWPPV